MPAGEHLSAPLCHSLVPHTIMQLFIILISLALFVAYAILIFYYRSAWLSIPDHVHPVNLAGNTQPVNITVIVPARNEATRLPALLESLSAQLYDKKSFEVIVVDDHSTDNTSAVVGQFTSGNTRLIRLSDHILEPGINAYKKKAIEVAIAQSSGELIVTTDADCIVPPFWLQTISSCYATQHPAFIVMPVMYTSQNSFLGIFQSLDFMTLQGITGAAVHHNAHSMCNGANLAYSRKAFESVEGFKGINHIASGDDMLLMHKIYKSFPRDIRYLKSKEVIVETEPMQSWKAFINQRIRWASKADRYDDKRIFAVLLLVYCLNLLMFVLPLLTLFYNPAIQFTNFNFSLLGFWGSLLILKTLVELYFLYPVAVFFGKRHLLWFFPVAQPVHILYTLIAGWLGKFGSYEWKERKVK